MYHLIMVWLDGEREAYAYATETEAETAQMGYHKAFGGQIQWTGVVKVNRKESK